MKRNLTFVLCHGILAASFADCPEQERVYSVCEALLNLKQLNGTVVAVRGLVGGGEGLWLESECPTKLVSMEYEWPSAISVAHPETKDTLHPVTFTRDETAMKKFWSDAKAKGYRKDRKLVATFVGMLETYPNLDDRITTYPSGSIAGMGFGHLGYAPAQIVLKLARDPEVLPETRQRRKPWN